MPASEYSFDKFLMREKNILKGILMLISGIYCNSTYSNIQFCIDRYEILDSNGLILFTNSTEDSHTNMRSEYWSQRDPTDTNGTLLYEYAKSNPETLGNIMELLSFGWNFYDFYSIIEIIQEDLAKIALDASSNLLSPFNLLKVNQDNIKWIERQSNDGGGRKAYYGQSTYRNPVAEGKAFEIIQDLLIKWIAFKFGVQVITSNLSSGLGLRS